MAETLLNKQVVLARRPAGAPRVEDFALIESPLPALKAGEILIENRFISLDAGFRKWMDEGSGDHILPAMAIGEPVMGLTLGRVLDSRHADFHAGQHLMARLAWERYAITDATDFLVVVPEG